MADRKIAENLAQLLNSYVIVRDSREFLVNSGVLHYDPNADENDTSRFLVNGTYFTTSEINQVSITRRSPTTEGIVRLNLELQPMEVVA